MKSRNPVSPKLRIVVATTVGNPDEQDDAVLAAQVRRGNALRIGLLEAGYDLVASLPADLYLPERIAQLQPDLIIIDAESDARDVLEHIVVASRDERRPIVLFTEDETPSSMEAAMAAGVSAYIVAGLQAERIKPVLGVALARFRQEQKLLDELADTRHKLAERKVVGTLTTKPVGSSAALSSATSDSSNVGTVNISAAVANAAPVANAGAARSVLPGAAVTIDGSASSDANGDPLAFAWTLSIPAGSSAVLSDKTASKPSFTTDVAGTYVASLVVNDGKVSSTAMTVAITATADLSQLFGTAASSSGSRVGTVWQTGATFGFQITNNSAESFTLTKYELLNGGAPVSTTMNATLLSGGDLTAGEKVGLTTTLAAPLDVSNTPGSGLRSIYYLTLTRTGQQFTIAYDWK